MMEIRLDGMEELQADLLRAVRAEPGMATTALEKAGKKFKRAVIKATRGETKKKTGKLAKGYKLDPVEGFGSDMHINFRATAPHFHLIENGHDIVMPKHHGVRGKKGVKVKNKNAGKVTGFVPGRFIVSKVKIQYGTQFPKDVAEQFNKMLEENNL